MKCGGVLIPDGTRHCFVQERGQHPSGRSFNNRELSLSVDHVIPRSQGGAGGPTHLVHYYDQCVQGGFWIPKEAQHQGSAAWSRKLTHEDRVRNGLLGGIIRRDSMTAEERSTLGRLGGTGCSSAKQVHLKQVSSRGNCTRWNIARGKFCVCGTH
jgi:hypothetical protein